jgi:hypothetical protein
MSDRPRARRSSSFVIRAGRRLACSSLVAAALVPMLLAESAQASFPGRNGRIAYSAPSSELGTDVFTVAANGSGRARLTTTGDASSPAWSQTGGNSPSSGAQEALAETCGSCRPPASPRPN